MIFSGLLTKWLGWQLTLRGLFGFPRDSGGDAGDCLHHRLAPPEARRPAFLLYPHVIGHTCGLGEARRVVSSL